MLNTDSLGCEEEVDENVATEQPEEEATEEEAEKEEEEEAK